ncbi:hypothetical protein [Anaerostipes butyraticus]|uniref:hypothetical protein n=1 Tax=Anaerostipes butyraticus TaxID=645466 RepID=UPI003208842D
MAVLALKQVETQQDASILQARLQKETSEVKNPYKGKVIEFMVSEDMETIASDSIKIVQNKDAMYT